MSRCLVLGANGFIGSHLVDALIKDGHQVRCFDRYKSSNYTFQSHPSKDIEIFRGDFLNRSNLSDALNGIDYVFHFISTTNPKTADSDPLIDIETNVKMSVELFHLCVERSVKKVLFASTGGAIYGDQATSEPLHEDLPSRPVSPYAIGKLTIEHYLRYFGKKHGLDYMVYRISNPYGPRQNTLSGQGVISIFLDLIRQGKPVPVFGDGNMVRDYIYVDDIITRIVKTFSLPSKEHIYNLGAGRGYSVNEIIDGIERVVGKAIHKEFVGVPATFVEKVVLNTERFEKEFGRFILTPLEDGITTTWQHIQSKELTRA